MQKIKVYLDDERVTPAGWVRTFTPAETIALLETGTVEELSLDHDLGGDDTIGTGYTVVLWIEEAVITRGFIAPKVIKVHSSNPCGRVKMEAGIKNIARFS